MTIDELIAELAQARFASPLKGETVVYLCEREREYMEIHSTMLDIDPDGAVCLLGLEVRPDE